MIDTIVRFLGLAPAHEGMWFMLAFIAITIALFVGLLIDGLSGPMSYGLYGNAGILLAGAMGGVALFARFVGPLRAVPAHTLLGITVGAAVTLFLMFALVRAGRQLE